ncbi:MAG: hypothetical protein ACKVS9_14530 [Phycisphaerae bacterium]
MPESRRIAMFDQSNHLAVDVFCSECGQNLRGLPRSGKCPECGTPTIWSLRGGAAGAGRDATWLRTVHHGTSLLTWAIIWAWMPPVWIIVWLACWNLTPPRRIGSEVGWPANLCRLLFAVFPAVAILILLPQLYLHWLSRGGIIFSFLDGFVQSMLAICAMHIVWTSVCIHWVASRYLTWIANAFLFVATFAGGLSCYHFVRAAMYMSGLGGIAPVTWHIGVGVVLLLLATSLLWRTAVVLSNRLEIALGDLATTQSARFVWQRSTPGGASDTGEAPTQ